MKISEALQLLYKKPCIVAFTGAGGKTTCMFRLAKELKEQGKKVLVTTTTNIYYPETWQYDSMIIQPDAEALFEWMAAVVPASITVAAKEFCKEIGKLRGFAPEVFNVFSHSDSIDYILVEADGSKRKPVKAPAGHEPVLPMNTDIVIGLTGFDCYGKKIDADTVFRMNEFCKITRKSEGENIDKEALLTLVTSEKGLFKTAPAEVRRVWVLNKVDDREHLIIAERVGHYISKRASFLDIVMISALNQEDPVKKVFKNR